jgi:hypothetical protein
VEEFFEKETEYINWLNTNPYGYVLNYFGSYNSEMNKLHRSDCRYLRRPSDEGKRTTRYKKVCSNDLEQLKAYIDREQGSAWSPCLTCLK